MHAPPFLTALLLFPSKPPQRLLVCNATWSTIQQGGGSDLLLKMFTALTVLCWFMSGDWKL